MKSFFTALTTAITLQLIVIAGIICMPGAQPYENYQLVWSDEFDVDGLPDASKWGYEEGCSVRNKELQYYTRSRLENARVENGFCIIEARKENMGSCSYTSANLVTTGKKSFKYGLFEIRAKIDIRAGSWPAWWWLPNSGGWPRGGEIDMMEFYQGKLLFNVMDGSQKWTSKTKAVSTIGGSEWAAGYHVWTWEWDSTKIDLWLDGTLMNHYLVANADGTGPNGENPFRRPGYMLINQAIGGNNGGDPSGTTFPVQYILDYVRYYQPGKDTTAPKVVSVTASAAGKIVVLFSENIDKTSAEKISCYTAGTAGITLSTAKLMDDDRTVIITASGLEIDARHTLTISGVADKASNALAEVTREFTVTRESVKLTGTVIGKGTPYNSASDVAYGKAVDGSTSTFADCTGDPVWVGYDFGEGAKCCITGFRYYPRSGYADRMSDKKFEISSDGTTWEKVHTISSMPQEGTFTTVSISDTKPVRYVRYNGSGGYLNVCEVEFWGYYADQAPLLPFNGKRIAHAAGSLLLQPPFTVALHSLDGRLIRQWKAGTGEGPVPFYRVLDRTAGKIVAPAQLLIVTITDARQQKMMFSVLAAK